MEKEIKGLNVHYESFGEGRPVVLIHGFTPDHRLMSGCYEPVFAKRGGYRRIYPDLPGMGRTPGAEWIKGSDQMLEVLIEFIEKELPGQNFLLAGESYGGLMSRGIVRRMPERVDGLMLLCPSIVGPKERRDLPEHVVLQDDPALMARLSEEEAEEFGPMAVVRSERTWQLFRDDILSGLRLADQAFLNRIRAEGYSFSFDPDAMPQPFMKPSLVLTGRQDHSVGYRDAWRILESFPRASFVVLDKAGHNLQIEQEALFAALVDEWLDRVEAEVPQK